MAKSPKLDLEKHKWWLVAALLFLALAFRISQYNRTDTWWDAAVYIGMGKYLYSAGQAGLWEDVRPLALPALLGASWKLGINPLWAGRILMTLFSLGSIYLIYAIGQRLADWKVGLLSATFLAFSPTFLFFDSQILTDIPSVFFALLGIYWFIGGCYALSGMLIGIAFMTRFLQLGVFVVLFLHLAISRTNPRLGMSRNLHALGKDPLAFCLGFASVFIPYLALNYLIYLNPFLPFTRQIFMSRFTGEVYWAPISFYLVNLVKENFLMIFALSGILLLRTKAKPESRLIVWLTIVYLFYFSIIHHKEMRFAVMFMPYLYLLVALGLLNAFSISIDRKVAAVAAMIVLLAWAYQGYATYKDISNYQPREVPGEFYEYLSANQPGTIWVSSPLFLLHSDAKAEVLMYYPLFDSARAQQLAASLGTANNVLIDSCDLSCPSWDSFCETEKGNLLNALNIKFRSVFFSDERGCQFYIYSNH